MTAETFAALLQTRLGDPHGLSYRLRWSPGRSTYMIEQRVGRAVFAGWDELSAGDQDSAVGASATEDLIRVRDGYSLVMEVSASPTFKCGCGYVFQLTPLKWKEYRCPACLRAGEKNFYYVAYFPLCDKLLEQLEQTSPARAHEFNRLMEARNVEKRAAAERAQAAQLEDVAHEWYDSSAGYIPKVGLAGRRQHNDSPAHLGVMR
jgi:hypothetical protein